MSNFEEKPSLVINVDKLIVSTKLTPRKLEVLKLRYDLDTYDKEPVLLIDVAKIFGISQERCRQIQQKALTKLIKNKETRYLAIYMDNPDAVTETLDELNRRLKTKIPCRYLPKSRLTSSYYKETPKIYQKILASKQNK